MQKLPKKLQARLTQRTQENALRKLPVSHNLIDFSSNDYLGFAKNEALYSNIFQLLLKKGIFQNGATGSRLLTGNHELYPILEEQLAIFHEEETALVFNSGYDANIGFFASVPQRGDVILYDEFIHASIRDGIKMSNAKGYKYKHNDLDDLADKFKIFNNQKLQDAEVYVVTESVFSMDGDTPELAALVAFSNANNCRLVVDEAHAIGIFGKNGQGLLHDLGLHRQVFARIITFGKAIGAHGAVILGSASLKEYLLNFARSIIYSTALSPHGVATVIAGYQFLQAQSGQTEMQLLQDNISYFNLRLEALSCQKEGLPLQTFFIPSSSAIHGCLVPGNKKVKSFAQKLSEEGFDVKAILSPTVPEGSERLRFCIHSYNSKEEIGLVLQLLSTYL
ncbi:MAG: pyridoxal phosphate-dependent aminotransferase family protein [Maribacter sp.]|nr:pyridoxal phosphate-dependent aminotransferase family protein [Maribacter sp.]